MLRTTLGLGIGFLVIALLAALVGFGGIASLSFAGAKILFFVFLVLAVLAFLGGYFVHRRGAL
jgi:uncharacterized membrane protein YtjA (UPF0391 family)